jgi:hypothetical protein
MEYDVRLEHVSSRQLAVVRRRASSQELAKVVPDACGTVWAVVRAQKIVGAGRHLRTGSSKVKTHKKPSQNRRGLSPFLRSPRSKNGDCPLLPGGLVRGSKENRTI